MCVIIKSIPVFWLESIINMRRFPSVQLQLVLLGCVWGAIQCVCVCVCPILASASLVAGVHTAAAATSVCACVWIVGVCLFLIGAY